MNTELIIISLLLVMLVFLPFLLIPFVQNRGIKNLKNHFRDKVNQFNLNVDLQEQWNCNFIGIDSAQMKFLFVQRIDEAFVSEFVDLNAVSQTQLLISEVKKKKNNKEEIELQRIDLEFSIYGQERKLVTLYDSDTNFTQDLEVKHAEKWNSHITSLLNSRPILKKSA